VARALGKKFNYYWLGEVVEFLVTIPSFPKMIRFLELGVTPENLLV
jgi:hypothetical protein